jgi:hypothetical protein
MKFGPAYAVVIEKAMQAGPHSLCGLRFIGAVEVISGHSEMTAMSEVIFGGGTRLESFYNSFDFANVVVVGTH